MTNIEQKQCFDKAAKLAEEAKDFESKGNYKSAGIKYSDIFPLFACADLFPSLADVQVKEVLIKTLENRGNARRKLAESTESGEARKLLEKANDDFAYADSLRTFVDADASMRRYLFNG